MYSKAESAMIKKEFWIAFASVYPRKWLLYNTKIKDVAFKFYVDNKKAQVMLDIEPHETQKRMAYFEKIESLKSILIGEFLPEAVFERQFYLENGKAISRVWVEQPGVSVNNKSTWGDIFAFFNRNMSQFELFFYEYEDYIKDLDTNI